MDTLKLFRSYHARLNHALIDHVLSRVKDEEWLDPIKTMNEVSIHLREHEVDDTSFYITSAYIFLALCEVKQRREDTLSHLVNNTTETIH
jgi:hypothetical protein